MNIGVQRGTARLEAAETTHPKLRLLMDRCFEDRAKNRPSFLQIIEILKNDVRPDFMENSFFGSKLGQMALPKTSATDTANDDWDVISEPTLISEVRNWNSVVAHSLEGEPASKLFDFWF